jgi:glycine/D-amino acid oxidase-like deaminating enzyme
MDLSYWERRHICRGGDLAIVGAGLTGLFTALFVREKFPHWKIDLFEKRQFGAVASTRNAGFACFGSPSEVLGDIDSMGNDAAIALVEKRWKGLERLKRLVPENAMRLKQNGGYEVFLNNSLYEDVRERLPDLNRAMADIFSGIVYHEVRPDHKTWKGKIRIDGEASLDPFALCHYLEKQLTSQGVQIYRGIEIADFSETENGVVLESEHLGEVRYSHLILATNALTSIPGIASSITPSRNVVLVSKPYEKPCIKGNYHEYKGYVYFRDLGNRLLIGGGRHWEMDASKTISLEVPNEQVQRLENYARENIPGASAFTTDIAWSGIIAASPRGDKRTLLKREGERTLVAARLSGMGVALSNVLESEAAELLCTYASND